MVSTYVCEFKYDICLDLDWYKVSFVYKYTCILHPFLHYRLVGKVELVVDKYRVDGSRVLIAEVDVGDETGVISLRARDEQIDLLRKVSSDRGAIVLRNCTMELYQGKHLRLGVSKWGKISVYPVSIFVF
jgi:hypothetical protein